MAPDLPQVDGRVGFMHQIGHTSLSCVVISQESSDGSGELFFGLRLAWNCLRLTRYVWSFNRVGNAKRTSTKAEIRDGG
jgi:hypothetical protein